MNKEEGMKTWKKRLIKGLVALFVISIIILFTVMPFAKPCYYPPLDWYNNHWHHTCTPVNIQNSSPVCTDSEQLSDDGTRCEKKLICSPGYQLSTNGTTCVQQPTRVYKPNQPSQPTQPTQPSQPSQPTQPSQPVLINQPNPLYGQNPTNPVLVSQPNPIICGSNQVLSNGMCIDKIEYQGLPDTTTNPTNPNPNLPNSTSGSTDTKPSVEPINIHIPSILAPDINIEPIYRKDFKEKLGNLYTTLQYYIKGDQVDKVTIIPKKNEKYKGICKIVITHSPVFDPKDPPPTNPIVLNAIGRTPATAPPASDDDLRPMSYFVWGDGKHMFSVIDKNSSLNYRIDTTIKFPYVGSS